MAIFEFSRWKEIHKNQLFQVSIVLAVLSKMNYCERDDIEDEINTF